MGRHKDPNTRKWEFWMARIPEDVARELRERSQYLVQKGKLKKGGKYELTQFALTRLLETLRKITPTAPAPVPAPPAREHVVPGKV